jgi:hypothetical protein
MAYNPYVTSQWSKPTFAPKDMYNRNMPSEYEQYKVQKEHYDKYNSPEALKRQASQFLSIYGGSKDTTGYLSAMANVAKTGQFSQVDAARLRGAREGQMAGAMAESYKQGYDRMAPILAAERQQMQANNNSRPSYAAGGTTGEGTFGSPLAALAAGQAAGQPTTPGGTSSGVAKPAIADRFGAASNVTSGASRFGRGRGWRPTGNKLTGTGATRTFGRGAPTSIATSGYDGNLGQATGSSPFRQATAANWNQGLSTSNSPGSSPFVQATAANWNQGGRMARDQAFTPATAANYLGPSNKLVRY